MNLAEDHAAHTNVTPEPQPLHSLSSLCVTLTEQLLFRFVLLGLHSKRVRGDATELSSATSSEAVHYLTRQTVPAADRKEVETRIGWCREQARARVSEPEEPLATRLCELQVELGLRPLAIEILLVLIAAHIHRPLDRMIRFGAGGTSTLGFVLDLLDPDGNLGVSDAHAALLPLLDAGLLTQRVCEGGDSGPYNVELSLPSSSARCLVEGPSARPEGPVRIVNEARDFDTLCVEPATIERLRRALRKPRTGAVALYGQPGLDCADITSVAASQLTGEVVELDCAMLSGSQPLADLLREASLEAWFRRACLHVRNADAVFASERNLVAVRDFLSRTRCRVFLSTTDRPERLLDHLPQLPCAEVASPSATTRMTYWSRIMSGIDCSNADVGTVLATFPLTPLEIRRIRARLDERKLGGDSSVTSNVLLRLASEVIDSRFEGIATRVTLRHTLEQLRIPASSMQRLHEMIRFCEHRTAALQLLGEAFAGGQGNAVTALFKGPPGTGKTMAAAVIAREAGHQLHQVNLAQLVSKYVGETEKNLERLFAQAEADGTVLLFDEADSLFSKRTSVSSSNDRYANAVVNFLLQKIEAFEGIVVLTTNNPNAIDTAFVRRIRFHIEFPSPNEETRTELWTRLLPTGHGLSRDELEVLGEDYELSGGHIKNVLLRAAASAVADGTSLTCELIRDACVEELRQQGHLVRD